MIRNIEAVIFDWAGTTIDFGNTCSVLAFTQAFSCMGVEVSNEEVRAPMGLSKRDHLRTMTRMAHIADRWKQARGQEPSEEDFNALNKAFETALFALLPQHCDIKPGVIKAVSYLRRHGIAVGSTTGFTTEMMDVISPIAMQGGYAPDTIVTADSVGGYGRPWPYMIFENMRRLHLSDVRKVLKVGDTAADIDEAKHAGCIAVGVLEGSSMIGVDAAGWQAMSALDKAEQLEFARESFYACGADFVINDMSGLIELVGNLDGMRRARRFSSQTF